MNITCGVPQGSILGPTYWALLYINDIYRVFDVLNLILFADDTNIFCPGKNLLQLCECVSKELNKLNL